MKVIYVFVLMIMSVLFSCSPTKRAAKKLQQARTLVARVTLTNQQQTDSIIEYGPQIRENTAQINEILKGFVFLDKNFKKDSAGNISLADTIFINAIMVKGKVLYIGITDSIKPHDGNDTLVVDNGFRADSLFKKIKK